MKKKISIIITTLLLTALGLSSELAKDVAVKIYCSIQPHDCQEK